MKNKHFLLIDQDGVNIAVISKKGKGSPSEFNAAIELAVKEHFSSEKATIARFEDNMKFEVSSDEDGEERVRDFTLQEIAVY